MLKLFALLSMFKHST